MKPLAPNTMIQGRYLVVHLIGKGGMGEVYLAVDQRLGSAVALKRTSFADDQLLAAAFEREAKILARLRHPVLPKVSDHFSENGELYLVMEHISGDDMSKRLETAGKPFPLSWVMFWADQLLDALAYLHSHEPPIIHRDIKPQNLKLTDENHIVLLDFGLSKDTANKSVVSQPGTSGSVVGYTPHFAPMEQIRGTGTNPRSDIYALSATLYQLISNTVPADALTRADAMLSGEPDPIQPLSDINPEISPAVSNVILKGLEVTQDKRFPTATEMQRALRAAHAQMQGQMTADTVAFNMSEHAGADIHSTSPPIDHGRSVAPSEMATVTPSIPTVSGAAPISANLESDGPSMDATIRMDEQQLKESLSQADVRTEVFLASDINAGAHAEPASPLESAFSQPLQNASSSEHGPTETWTPDPASSASSTDLRVHTGSTASSGSEPPSSFNQKTVEPEGVQTAAAPTVPAGAGTAQPSKPKPRSKSKAAVILAILAAFFILMGALAGGGWYFYANYVGGGKSSPSPSPTIAASPSATPLASPTAEPTQSPDLNVVDSNSNSTGTASNDGSVSATPTPTTEPVTPRSIPKVEPTRNQVTITKPSATPGAKPTPKVKPSNDRTVILQ
ncbi:MAG: protein kinase [Acidobacteriota bacterium]